MVYCILSLLQLIAIAVWLASSSFEKMTNFQIDINKRSGAVTIWIEATCSLKPILICHDLEGMKEFGEMLLNFYRDRKREKERIENISNNLIEQALSNKEYLRKESE